MIGGKVFDTTALLAFASGNNFSVPAVIAAALDIGFILALPAAALQTAWQHGGDQAAPALDYLAGLSVAIVLDLDAAGAREAGRFAAAAGQEGAPVGTVQAVHIARVRDWPIVTGDVDQVLALDPQVLFESLP